MDINNISLPGGLRLEYTDKGLTLTDGELTLTADLTHMLPRLKPNNLNGEMLIKAAKIKNAEGALTLLDATAGFAEDSLLLAAAGFNVSLYEYDPVIGALLEDALKRAEDVPELTDIVERMTLYKEDSIRAMREMKEAPDVILLDPMFPERKKTGLIKKKFQLLQRLEAPCSEESELLSAALALKPQKLIIKRPLKGPFLDGRRPSYSLSGSAIRYDCFINIM